MGSSGILLAKRWARKQRRSLWTLKRSPADNEVATTVSSMPGSYGSYPTPDFASLLNHHLHSLNYLVESQIKDSRGRQIPLAYDLSQYNGPHRHRRSAPPSDEYEGYGSEEYGADYHGDQYDGITPFFNVPRLYAHYDYKQLYPFGFLGSGGYSGGYGGGHGGAYGGGYNYKPRYGGYYRPYSGIYGG